MRVQDAADATAALVSLQRQLDEQARVRHDPPLCQWRFVGGRSSILANTWTTMAGNWNVVRDARAMSAVAGGALGVTVPMPGWWYASFKVPSYNTNPNATIACRILLDGAVWEQDTRPGTNAADGATMHAHREADVATGAKFTFQWWSSTGGVDVRGIEQPQPALITVRRISR